MALDLESFSPEARRRYIRIGRRYETPDVLAQTDQIVFALVQHGPIVAQHGFGAEEQEQVGDARGMLQERQHGTDQAVAQRSITGQTYEDAVEDGKAVRQSARAACKTVDKSATEKGELDVSRVVRTALTQTSRLRANKFLVDHLSTLHTAVTTPIVLPFVIPRGGGELLVRLQNARDALRTAQSARAGHNAGDGRVRGARPPRRPAGLARAQRSRRRAGRRPPPGTAVHRGRLQAHPPAALGRVPPVARVPSGR